MGSVAVSDKVLLRLFDAAVSPDLWPDALDALARDAGAVGCCIAIDGTKETLIAPAMSSALVEPLEDFVLSGWCSRDLRGERGWPQLRAGRPVLLEHDISDEKERRRSAYYNEWLRPWNLPWWAAVAVPSGDSLFGFAILRSARQGPFEREDEAALLRWRPFLVRAVTLAQHLSRSRAGSVLDLLQRLDRAAFLIDSFGRVCEMNAEADALLGHALFLRRDRLKGATREDDRVLQLLISSIQGSPFPAVSAAGEPVALRCGGARMLVLDVYPTLGLLADCFGGTRGLILVTDLSRCAAPPKGRLRNLFGLTEAEGALAAELSTGADLRTAAERLRIATGTARNQLKAIFAKTEVHRQADLVALMQRLKAGS